MTLENVTLSGKITQEMDYSLKGKKIHMSRFLRRGRRSFTLAKDAHMNG